MQAEPQWRITYYDFYIEVAIHVGKTPHTQILPPWWVDDPRNVFTTPTPEEIQTTLKPNDIITSTLKPKNITVPEEIQTILKPNDTVIPTLRPNDVTVPEFVDMMLMPRMPNINVDEQVGKVRKYIPAQNRTYGMIRRVSLLKDVI